MNELERGTESSTGTCLFVGRVGVPLDIKLPFLLQLRVRDAAKKYTNLRAAPLPLVLNRLGPPRNSLRRPRAIFLLQHRLSPIALERMSCVDKQKFLYGRNVHSSLVEREIAVKYQEDFFQSLQRNRYSLFLSCIKNICSAATGQEAFIRAQDIKTNSDAQGAHWQFMKPTEIDSVLRGLFEHLCNANGQTALVRAVIAHVVFCLAHPFFDGNGRTGRILFNLVLQENARSDVKYVPCSELFALSHMGYHLNLRGIHINNDWIAMIGFFCKIIDAFYIFNKRALRNNGLCKI